jgi:uncharacterized phiE125 gp8 family phage protein
MITVTTPAATTDLTTLAAVKAELGLSTNEHEAQLSTYIRQASDTVERYCNRTFARESVSETFLPNRCLDSLMLTCFPVTAIASVVENGTTLASTDYKLEADTGVLFRVSNEVQRLWSRGKIVVDYDCGYLLPGDDGRDLPHDIERAAIMLAAQSFLNAGTDASVKRESVDGIGSTERFSLSASGMTPEAEAILARYRQVAI